VLHGAEESERHEAELFPHVTFEIDAMSQNPASLFIVKRKVAQRFSDMLGALQKTAQPTREEA
jgi:hypothetical protein